MDADSLRRSRSLLREEWGLWFGAGTAVLFLVFAGSWLADLSNPLTYGALFVWVLAAMLSLSFTVVRHAHALAVKLGEPYGTLILTLAVVGIEVVMISAVMLTGGEKPTLGRDMMFSALMLVLNGMLGLSVLVGAWRHWEQSVNLRGESAYLGLIIPFALLGLVLPRFTTSAPPGETSASMAVFLCVVSIGLYAIFLVLQTTRHRAYFVGVGEASQPESIADEHDHEHLALRSTTVHIVLLVLAMVPIVLLSKKFAVLLDHGLDVMGAPLAIGGFLVATLVLLPEGVSAVQAARADKIQRSVNLSLGSSLSMIGLTLPAVLGISLATGLRIELGLEAPEIVLLVTTLLVSVVHMASGRTNILQGLVHLLLLAAYVMLLLD